MDSEDSRDAAPRGRSSSCSSSSSEEGPSSPMEQGRGGPDSPVEHPDSSLGDGPASPMEQGPYSPSNTSQQRSQMSFNDNSGPNSPSQGPESPKSERYHSPDPKSRNSSVRSLRSSQSSLIIRRSQSPKSPKSPASNSRSPRSYMNSRNSHSPRSPGSLGSNHNSRNSRSKSPKSPTSDRISRNSPSKSPKYLVSDHISRNSHKTHSRMSDSSVSSRDSSNGREHPPEPPTEEISDCDIESDHKSDNELGECNDKVSISDGSNRSPVKSPTKPGENNLNLSHEDLSDVSDLESAVQSEAEEETDHKPLRSPVQAPKITDLRLKLDEAKKHLSDKVLSPPTAVQAQKDSKPEDAEEALDFEAEEGECLEPAAPKVEGEEKEKEKEKAESKKDEGELDDEEELEEGEVTDEDDNRPEETEPRPVCRFFARGQCTWGISCRFLHPGVTDKGNYTMFDMVRPVAGPPGVPSGFGPGHDFRERAHLFQGGPGGLIPRGAPGEPAVVESAWERGLRTAKEMMRKANKRKEQDMDFEEKKMNLTLGQDEIERENGYYARAASPPRPLSPEIPVYTKPRHVPPHDGFIPRKEEGGFFRRLPYEEPRLIRVEPPEFDEFVPHHDRERGPPRYRELPPHRMPQYEEHEPPVEGMIKRRIRPTREVIVQRVEGPPARGDEWADPWMRSKSPGGRRGKDKVGRRSYSSGSSYTSSSSTRSTSSHSHSSGSRSRSPRQGVPRNPSHHKGGSRGVRPVSPSVIVSEKRAATERAALMNPPAPSPRKRPHSPAMMRRSAQNPPAPAGFGTRDGRDKFGRAKPNPSLREATDAFGRTRREVDRVMTERSRQEASTRNVKPNNKQTYKQALERGGGIARKRRSSSSVSGSSDSSSSDSESSYTSSSSSREPSPVTARRGIASDSGKPKSDPKTVDKTKSKIDPKPNPDSRKKEDSRKERPLTENNKKRPATSPPEDKSSNKSPSGQGKKASSRREELLKQLKAVEDAIARKRSKI